MPKKSGLEHFTASIRSAAKVLAASAVAFSGRAKSDGTDILVGFLGDSMRVEQHPVEGNAISSVNAPIGGNLTTYNASAPYEPTKSASHIYGNNSNVSIFVNGTDYSRPLDGEVSAGDRIYEGGSMSYAVASVLTKPHKTSDIANFVDFGDLAVSNLILGQATSSDSPHIDTSIVVNSDDIDLITVGPKVTVIVLPGFEDVDFNLADEVLGEETLGIPANSSISAQGPLRVKIPGDYVLTNDGDFVRGLANIPYRTYKGITRAKIVKDGPTTSLVSEDGIFSVNCPESKSSSLFGAEKVNIPMTLGPDDRIVVSPGRLSRNAIVQKFEFAGNEITASTIDVYGAQDGSVFRAPDFNEIDSIQPIDTRVPDIMVEFKFTDTYESKGDNLKELEKGIISVSGVDGSGASLTKVYSLGNYSSVGGVKYLEGGVTLPNSQDSESGVKEFIGKYEGESSLHDYFAFQDLSSQDPSHDHDFLRVSRQDGSFDVTPRLPEGSRFVRNMSRDNIVDNFAAWDIEMTDSGVIATPKRAIYELYTPSNNAVVIGDSIGFAAIDLEGWVDEIAIIPPSSNKIAIAYENAFTGNSFIDVPKGSKLFLTDVSNMNDLLLADSGLGDIYPVNNGKISVNGKDYDLYGAEVRASFSPVLQTPEGNSYPLTGADFKDLVAVADRSIARANSKSTTTTVTDTTTTTVTPSTSSLPIPDKVDNSLNNALYVMSGMMVLCCLATVRSIIKGKNLREEIEDYRRRGQYDHFHNPVYEDGDLEAGMVANGQNVHEGDAPTGVGERGMPAQELRPLARDQLRLNRQGGGPAIEV